MCLAVFHPALGGEVPTTYMTRAEFAEANHQNPHGIGLLWAKEGKLRHSKFYNEVGRAWQSYKSVRELGVPMAVHFRWATHGKRGEDNCHPFFVHDELAIIHNGILPLEDPADEKTDTQLFAERLRETGKDPMAPDMWPLVEMATVGSKVVFMRASGEVFIAHQKNGHWRDGSWYSNTSYSTRMRQLGSGWSGTQYSAYDEENWVKEEGKDSKWTWDPKRAREAREAELMIESDEKKNERLDKDFMDYLKTGEKTAAEVEEDLKDLPSVGQEDSSLVVGMWTEGMVQCLECAPTVCEPGGLWIRADEAASALCDRCGEALVW